jgi:hypothetical protein
MSQVAKSASAFVRAFLAILVLELEDMVVHWCARPNSPALMAIVGQFAWVSRLASGVPLGAGLAGEDLTLAPKQPSGRRTNQRGLPAGFVDPTVCSFADIMFVSEPRSSLTPTWSSLGDCPESYSSRRILWVSQFLGLQGNSHEKDERDCGVGAVADFFRSDGGRAAWRRRRARSALRCGGVWTRWRRGGRGRGVCRRTIDCAFLGL